MKTERKSEDEEKFKKFPNFIVGNGYYYCRRIKCLGVHLSL